MLLTYLISQGISRNGYVGCIANAIFRGKSIIIRARYNILNGCPNVAVIITYALSVPKS